MTDRPLSRRGLLKLGALGTAGIATGGGSLLLGRPRAEAQDHGSHHDMSTVGDIRPGAFDPTAFLTAFDWGRESRLPSGQVLREYEMVADEREIEVAPGVFYPAWTYNGQVPGPTLRCTEGDRVRVRFTNRGTHPHSIHFHGIHPANMDGAFEMVQPGGSYTYEFDAEPFALQLYHCHTVPLKRHLHKGLYGAFIVNPDPAKRGDKAKERHPDHAESQKWQELVVVMNAFDTNFDGGNEVYAINSVAFHHMKNPIVIDKSRPVRIYLVNVIEFDLLNSFHLHANFFDYYDTGTTLEPTLRTVDLITQAQAQRGILEFGYAEHDPGLYMFHAHQSEFAELGWMSHFEVV